MLLERFADAWNRHDLDALMSMMTDDCVFEASAGPDVNGQRSEGRQAVRAAFAAVFLAALFAWNHQYPLPQTLSSFGFAIGVHLLYIRYQSISGCIFMHAVTNGFRHAGRYLAGVF